MLFFSNIGRLARTIKSRKHPAKNLVNQYLRMLPLTNSAADEDDQTEAAPIKGDDNGDDERHPLIYLGRVDSETLPTDIVWPEMTRWTSRRKYRNVRSHVRSRLLLPALGRTVLGRLAKGAAAGFEWTTVDRPIRVGMWTFTSSEAEQRADRKYVSSWFSIRIKDVAHLNDNEQPQDIQDEVLSRGQDALLYGRFHHFARIELPEAKPADRLQRLGRCTLYNSSFFDPITKLDQFDTTQPLQYFDGKKLAKVGYVQLASVHSQIAIGPAFRFRPGGGEVDTVRNRWVAMPLQK